MSIGIIGGHDRMCGQYQDICKEYGCKSKVFTQADGNLESKIGSPDLIVVFTNPVSHKMVKVAKKRAAKYGIALAQSHCGSGAALRGILDGCAAAVCC
jgi:hypothetical protein